MVNLVLSGAPKFDTEFMEEAVAALREAGEHRAATAHVIAVDGFAGAAVRSMLSTINLVASLRRPVHVSADVPTAARWLTETLEGHEALSWTRGELEQALCDLCVVRGT